MSIASEIERIISDKNSIKDAIESKDENITIGETERIDSYASYIEQIESGVAGELHSRYVTPSNVTQEVVPLSGYDGMSELLVLGSSNLVPENIKKGVTIFGVTGTYEYAEAQEVHYKLLYNDYYANAETNQCIETTGGWELTFTTNANYGQVTYNTTGLKLSASYSGGGHRIKVATANSIDFTGYVKFVFRASASGYLASTHGYYRNVGFTDDSSFLGTNVYPKAYSSSTYLLSNKQIYQAGPKFYVIDTTDIDGKYYPFLMAGTDMSKYSTALNVDNMFLLMQDDWQTLCEKAGLVTSDYEDEDDLCANSAAMTTILANQEAVNYMISKCTGTFMYAFITSSTALEAYDGSPFKTTIRANEHWDKFITMVYAY